MLCWAVSPFRPKRSIKRFVFLRVFSKSVNVGLSFGGHGGDFNQRSLVNYHEIGASAPYINVFEGKHKILGRCGF